MKYTAPLSVFLLLGLSSQFALGQDDSFVSSSFGIEPGSSFSLKWTRDNVTMGGHVDVTESQSGRNLWSFDFGNQFDKSGPEILGVGLSPSGELCVVSGDNHEDTVGQWFRDGIQLSVYTPLIDSYSPSFEPGDLCDECAAELAKFDSLRWGDGTLVFPKLLIRQVQEDPAYQPIKHELTDEDRLNPNRKLPADNSSNKQKTFLAGELKRMMLAWASKGKSLFETYVKDDSGKLTDAYRNKGTLEVRTLSLAYEVAKMPLSARLTRSGRGDVEALNRMILEKLFRTREDNLVKTSFWQPHLSWTKTLKRSLMCWTMTMKLDTKNDDSPGFVSFRFPNDAIEVVGSIKVDPTVDGPEGRSQILQMEMYFNDIEKAYTDYDIWDADSGGKLSVTEGHVGTHYIIGRFKKSNGEPIPFGK